MLKRPITYKDADGVEQTEIFYFHFSQPELVEWEVNQEGGMGQVLQRIIDEQDNREILKHFKEIILRSYGKRTEDGRGFTKSEELRTKFEQSFAYEVLYMELMTKEGAAAEFCMGILPADMPKPDQDKPSLPPPPKIGDTKPAN